MQFCRSSCSFILGSTILQQNHLFQSIPYFFFFCWSSWRTLLTALHIWLTFLSAPPVTVTNGKGVAGSFSRSDCYLLGSLHAFLRLGCSSHTETDCRNIASRGKHFRPHSEK